MARPTGDTGHQKITPTGGDGETVATGLVQPVTGLEQRPCTMCRSFDKNEPKLVEYLRARVMTIELDGSFTTPIMKDFPGAKSLKLDIKDFGWCRHMCAPTDMLATCQDWVFARDITRLVPGNR